MSKPENRNVKKSRVFLGREAWINHVNEFKKSGLTQPAYAKRHNLNMATFRNWVARLKKKNRRLK